MELRCKMHDDRNLNREKQDIIISVGTLGLAYQSYSDKQNESSL